MRSSWKKRIAVAGLLPPFVVAALWFALEGVLAFFPDVRPRFWNRVRDESGSEWFVASSNPPIPRVHFRTDRFLTKPPSGTRRVLCLGDSTMYGYPFDPPVPFANWIQLRLGRLLPRQSFQVVNVGATGLCSENVLDTLRELEGAGADVVVVYVGHNEFLDLHLPSILRPMTHAIGRSLRSSRVAAWLSPSRSGHDDVTVSQALATPGPVHDEPFLSVEQFDRGYRRCRENVSSIAEFVSRRGISLVLCEPVADALDTPPQYSSFTRDLADADRARFNQEVKELRRTRRAIETELLETGLDESKLETLRNALATVQRLILLDPGVAVVHYENGRLLRLAGRLDEASRELRAALDLDGYPCRLTTRGREIVESVATKYGALLVDPAPAFAAESHPDLPGNNGLFVDGVHPDRRGHEIVGDVLLHALASASLLAPTRDWQFDDEPSIDEYRRANGYRPSQQADAWARAAFFLLGESSFDARNTAPLEAADRKLDDALRLDGDCAAAHLGKGVLAAIHHESTSALAEFDRAATLDATVMQLLTDAYADNAVVRQVLTNSGLTVRDGRVVRVQ